MNETFSQETSTFSFENVQDELATSFGMGIA